MARKSYDSLCTTGTIATASDNVDCDAEYYYTIFFPNTHVEPTSAKHQRISYRDSVEILRSVTSGGKERERKAKDEFKNAWIGKFRTSSPVDEETVSFRYFQELFREVMIQRYDAIQGLFLKAKMSEDGEFIMLRFRPSRTLLCTTAQNLATKIPIATQIEPGESYWSKGNNADNEITQLTKTEAQEELYRMFLAGHISSEEAQIFDSEHDKECAAMWSKRINALKRFSDPSLSKYLNERTISQIFHLPYKFQRSLQFLYRHIYGASDSSEEMPFRFIDKIRLTKSIIDAEFDCDALMKHNILSYHMCNHSYHSDSVDCSIETLRRLWGAFLSPFTSNMKLTAWSEMFYYQPIEHVRNYFGEELALYFAYTSFYGKSIQNLCIIAILLYSCHHLIFPDIPNVLFLIGFCLSNCLFVQRFVRKWEVQERCHAITWGVEDIDSYSMQIRPQFRGKLKVSSVTHRPEPFYDPKIRTTKRLFSNVLLLGLVCALIWVYLRLMELAFFKSLITSRSSTSLVPRWTLVVLMKLISWPLSQISHILNEWENYRTYVEYDSNLTLKFTFVQTANSYFILVYIAIFWPFFGTCGERTCQVVASDVLQSILVFDLILSCWELRHSATEFVLSKINSFFSVSVDKDQLIEKATLKDELALAKYDGVLFDYAQIMISFGYVSWFAPLSPLLTCVAWLIAVIQIRTDAYKLCFLTQRPFPLEKNSIGSWKIYLHFLSFGALMFNGAMATVLISSIIDQQQLNNDLVNLNLKIGTVSQKLTLEWNVLAVFSVFGSLWFLMGLNDRDDRAKLNMLQFHQEKQSFLENKYLNNTDKISNHIYNSLPPGRIFLNGVRSYVITGNKEEEDQAEEIFDELAQLQAQLSELQRKIVDLQVKSSDTEVGKLHVEVCCVNILPIMDNISKSVDSFVKVKIQEKNVFSPVVPNTSVIKKNRSPQWNEKFEFCIRTLDIVLHFFLYDWELCGSNRKIGAGTLSLLEILNHTKYEEKNYQLHFSSRDTVKKLPTISEASALRIAAFEIPIEMPGDLFRTLRQDLEKHGNPRLTVHCGVELQEIGELMFQHRNLEYKIESLKSKEQQFFVWRS